MQTGNKITIAKIANAAEVFCSTAKGLVEKKECVDVDNTFKMANLFLETAKESKDMT